MLLQYIRQNIIDNTSIVEDEIFNYELPKKSLGFVITELTPVNTDIAFGNKPLSVQRRELQIYYYGNNNDTNNSREKIQLVFNHFLETKLIEDNDWKIFNLTPSSPIYVGQLENQQSVFMIKLGLMFNDYKI